MIRSSAYDMTGKIKLRPEYFTEDKVRDNGLTVYRLHLESKFSRTTILRYLKQHDVSDFRGDILYSILTIGFGLSDEEIMNMRFSDLFEIEHEDE